MTQAEPPRTDLRAGVAALLACAALWSLAGPLIKTLSSGEDGVSGFTIAFYRSLFGGLVFLPLALRRRDTLRHVSTPWAMTTILAFTLMTTCFVVATTQTAAANAIILQYTSPLWVFALAPLLLGERARPSDVGWLLLAMAGVGVILALQWETDLAGLATALGAGFGYGLLTVLLRKLRGVDPSVVVAMNFLGSALLLTPLALAWGGLRLGGEQLLLALVLGIVQMALPYVIFSWALRRVPAHLAALVVLCEALFNPALTWLVVGEPTPPATLYGGALILAGIIGVILSAARRTGRPGTA